MNCEQFKNIFNEQSGELQLPAVAEEHLKICRDCRDYYRDLLTFREVLAVPEISMTAQEAIRLNEKLDYRIAGYTRRAFGFYNWFTRYGVSLAAVILLVAVSLISTIPSSTGVDTIVTQLDFIDSYAAYDTESYDLDEEYLNVLVDEYKSDYRYNSAEDLIGEIDTLEFDYLMQTIDVGDIL
jgi:predicted anti-sigma-YlaC factor YlaD